MSRTETAGGEPRIGTLQRAALMAGPFLSMIDSSIVNVALKDLATGFGSSLQDAQWVVTGFQLAFSATLPLTAWLSRRWGNFHLYLLSMVGFTLSSLLCGLAPSMAALVAFRVLQGAMGAFLIPLAMNSFYGRAKPGETPKPPIALGLLLFMAPAIGPSLGGILLEFGSWPLIFFVNLPFALASVLMALPALSRERGDRGARANPVGLILLCASVTAISYGVSESMEGSWFDPGVWPYWAGGLLGLGAAMVANLRMRDPVLDVGLLRHRNMAVAAAVAMLANAVAYAIIVLAPLYMQTVQGHSALEAGLALIPQALLSGLGIAVGAPLAKRIGLKPTVVAGLALLAAGSACCLLIEASTSAALLSLALCGRAFATGLAVQPILGALNATVPKGKGADANTLFMLAQRLGGAIGVALLVSYFGRRTTELLPVQGRGALSSAFHETIVFMSAAALCCAFLMLLGWSRRAERAALEERRLEGVSENEAGPFGAE
jgi:EmrB/QacA subfamily drug resistance transporter